MANEKLAEKLDGILHPGPKERFNILNSFLGFGDPRGEIWFIGLEEAGSWSQNPEDDSETYAQYSRGYIPVESGAIKRDAARYGSRYTKTYDIMSKIAVALLSGSIAKSCDWKTYRDELLLTDGSDTFQVNLFPLGKKSLKEWPTHYKLLFGFGPENIQSYYDEVAKKRFPFLKAERRKYRPKITICFGKKAWPQFEMLFSESNTSYMFDGCKIFNDGLILCPFFNPRFMPDTRIDSLVAQIKDLLVKL